MAVVLHSFRQRYWGARIKRGSRDDASVINRLYQNLQAAVHMRTSTACLSYVSCFHCVVNLQYQCEVL